MHAAAAVALSALMGCGGASDAAPGTSDTASAVGAHATATSTAKLLIHYPTGFGHRVTVHCGGLGRDWNTPIETTWTTGDVWTVTLSTTAALQCKPLFDDTTCAVGPNWSLAVGQTLDMWPYFFHTVGRITQTANWHSTILNDDRGIWTYFPPSYDENPHERYPVVYMHDGQNLFYDEDAFGGVSWAVGGAMDTGAANATIHEAIIIGIDNDADRINEYTPVPDPDNGGGNAAKYLAFITNELKPQIDQQLRTFADADHTAIVGSSLGGLVSLYAGLARPDVFHLVGALSPSTWWDNTWIIGQSTAALAPLPTRVYIDSGNAGTSNDDVTNTAALANVWKTKSGVTVDYLVQNGASHSETYWRQRVPGTLGFLLGGR